MIILQFIARVALLGLASSVLLPASAVAQSAPVQAPPVKAVVVVQQTSTASSAPAPASQTGATLATPTLTVQVPASGDLGVALTVRAVLVAPDGAPVEGAPVDFSSPANFLNTPGSMVLGRAMTDDRGAAVIEWEPRSSGTLTLNAAFAGDKHLSATKATATVHVAGDQQLYQQQAGVVLPGLNAAPAFTRMAALAPIASPWPRLSGWPLVVVLLIVWSLYARAVAWLFTIARGREPKAVGREGA